MDNQRLNSDLRDKLLDLESPFNERVSFEAVMKKREKKKRRAILWIPSMVVVAGLFVLGGLGVMWVQTDQQPEKAPQVAVAKAILKPSLGKKAKSPKAEPSPLKLIQELQAEKGTISSHRGTQKHPSHVEKTAVLAEIPNLAQIRQEMQPLKVVEMPEMMAKVDVVNAVGSPVEIVDATPDNSNLAAKEFDASQGLCDPQGLEMVSLGIADPLKNYLEIPEGEYEAQWDPALLQSKWYAEMSATTGSSVVINFNEDDRLSILGNIYHANYHGLLLKDIGSGFMIGSGISYGEIVGTGEWRVREFQERMSIDSYDLVVMIPPVQTVRVYDTTYTQVRVETEGALNFRIDKFAIPLAARYHFMLGKMAWRAAAQLNPGFTVKTSGDFFTNTEYSAIERQKNLTMDLKLAVGPTISIYKDWFLILEPNLMHHTYRDLKSGVSKGKTLTGFGVSVLHNF